MCGILAIFGDWSKLDYKLEKCISVLSKRGPDTLSKIIIKDGILCFARLSIMDVSEAGNQPFINDGVYMMCNGEIYNYKELIEKYSLIVHSGSDCEVILALYKKIGFEEMVNELRGVFALIIVDGENIYLARDRIGVRPLFLGIDDVNGLFSVGSVAGALEFGYNRVIEFTPGYASYSRENGIVSQKQYKKLKYYPIVIKEDENFLYNIIRETLTEAVKKRLITDRPIGCLLSGGVDSSLIVSILCKLIGSNNVRTYSIGMEGSLDLKYAKIVADYLGTHHTEIHFTPKEGLSVIPEVIKNIESYDITTIRASVGMYLAGYYISRKTDDKVIFSGEGSDELFAGYLYFHKAPNDLELEKESNRLIDDLYLYDVLRADRTISSNGLELRVPFLDWDFVNLCKSIKGSYKMPKNGYEKFILRNSFKGYLPDEILWRRKDGFSDGVSGISKPWYKYIQEHADKIISDDDFKQVSSQFPSKEAYWYKNIFNENFKHYRPHTYYWLPKWSGNSTEPSGRNIMAFEE